MKKNIVLVLIILFSGIIFYYFKNQQSKIIVDYLGNYEYSVGTIENYFERGTIGHNIGKSSITYSFKIGNENIIKNYDILFYKLPENPIIGDKYIVLYNIENFENSILLGNYKINHGHDINKIIEIIKKNPPKF